MPEGVCFQLWQSDRRSNRTQRQWHCELLSQLDGYSDNVVGCRDNEWHREKTGNLIIGRHAHSCFLHTMLDLDVWTGWVRDEEMPRLPVLGQPRRWGRCEWVGGSKQTDTVLLEQAKLQQTVRHILVRTKCQVNAPIL